MSAERAKRQPDTELDSTESAPPTSLDGDVAGAPPTSLDGDQPPGGDTYLQLPRPLRPDYEALKDMASGGEGDLLLVRHRESGERRVVKIYRGERRRDEQALEVLSGALEQHVVKVYKSGRTDGRSWEVMEYCEQGSLADLIEGEGPRFSSEQIVAVVAEVAAALEHMHELHIPHRDLKPGNILIRTREPLDLRPRRDARHPPGSPRGRPPPALPPARPRNGASPRARRSRARPDPRNRCRARS